MRECNLTRMAARKSTADDAMAVQALVQVGAALSRALEDATRRAGGVCLSQHNVLGVLARAEPAALEPRQIAAATGSGSAHVTMLLDSLVQEGLVERRAHPTDRRRREVVLTDAGREREAATSAAIEVTARGVLARAAGVAPDDVLAIAQALDEAVGDIGGPITAGTRPTRPGALIPGGR